MRRTPLLLLTVLGLVVLSGCFKLDADFKVNDDETVDGTMIVALDEEFSDMMSSMGEGSTGEDEFFSDPADLPEGAEVEDYSEDGFVGQKVTFEGVTLEEMMSSADEDGAVSDEWSLTHEDGEFVFEGSFDMSSEDDEMVDMSALMKDAEISISMEFPGDVSESNGDIDGNRVTWEPKVGEKNEMRAVASDEAGFPFALLGGVVAVLALVAAVVVFLLLRRRESAASAAAAPGPGPAAGGTPQEGAPEDLTPRT